MNTEKIKSTSNTPLLEIKNLNVKVEDKTIIENLDLTINFGEIHAIMGPNGSGKSTLANVLARNPNYDVIKGSIKLLGQDILSLKPEECAHLGIFLGFQYPVSIPGISNIHFLKTAINVVRKSQGKQLYDAVDFLQIVKKIMINLDMSEELLYRGLNEGFSGGEKKLNEILQMSLLEPKFAILDETDSGLDIDALKIVANGVNNLRSSNRSFLLITHYQRLLDYITPDYVHVLSKGKIIHTGNKYLPHQLEQKGYSWLNEKDTNFEKQDPNPKHVNVNLNQSSNFENQDQNPNFESLDQKK